MTLEILSGAKNRVWYIHPENPLYTQIKNRFKQAKDEGLTYPSSEMTSVLFFFFFFFFFSEGRCESLLYILVEPYILFYFILFFFFLYLLFFIYNTI